VVQSLLEMEIGEVVGDQLVAQKVANFSYCLRKAFLK